MSTQATKMINLRIAGIVVAVIATVGFGIKIYYIGYENAQAECAKDKLQSVTRAIKQTQKINAENQEIVQEYWQQKLAEKPKIKYIEKRILKYVQDNNNDTCNLDNDQLHIINDLIDIANGNGNNRPIANAKMPADSKNDSK